MLNNKRRTRKKQSPLLQKENSIIPQQQIAELPLNLTEEEIITYYEPKPSPPAVEPKKRAKCPNGTRRNKEGKCVPIRSENPLKQCPKDTQRNDVGECVPIDIVEPIQEADEGPIREADKGPIRETDKGPIREADKGPIRETDKGPIRETDKGPIREADKGPIRETDEGPIRETDKGPIRETDEGEQSKDPEQNNQPATTKKIKMNGVLEKKEKYESEHILTDHDYLYPDLNDPDFNIKIAIKKEFHDTQYDGKIRDIEKQANLICKAKFELSSHQVFVKNFLSVNTPYKSMLLYHGLGTGKTCSAIGVAEEMRQYMKRTGLKRQIIVVASPNVQGNFRQQLFDERKLTKVTNVANQNEFTWNIESCVGNSLIHEINPNSIRNLTREKLISNINSLINENYAFMGYIQFANVAKANMLLNATNGDTDQTEKNIRRFFDSRLIIIDEVHNIRLADDSNKKEFQQVAAILMQIVKYARGMRLLLLSATPMFNSYKEIIWIVNLLNANDCRSQIETSDIFQSDGSFQPDGQEILQRKLTGYVSYVRGENPYTFPYRLYPSVFSPENSLQSFDYPRIQMNGVEIDTPIQNIQIYLNRAEKTSYQMQVYLSIIDYMRRKSHGFYTTTGIYREMPSFENMESFGYILLQRPLEALNIVYPDAEITQMLSEPDRSRFYTDELFQNAVGGTGLSNVMTFSTIENDEPLKHEYEYKDAVLKKHGRIFSPSELGKYSAKMAEICDSIKRSEGIVLIYTQYIDGGVVPMALALEEMGFSRYSHAYAGRHKHLFKRAPTSQIDAIQMVPRGEIGTESAKFQPAQYIMITGDRGLSPSNTEDVKYATSADNMDGSKVKVIIISKAGSEGLDFKAIRQIHIMEPWFNMNRVEQIIGRGVRNLSHCALPFKKRNVEIYLHTTFIEGTEEEAADLYLYRLAEKKAMQIGKVTRLLKQTAVDCILNIEQTNFTADKLSSWAANQNIRLELSSRHRISGEVREVNFRIGDLDRTEICDYMSCEYQCRPAMSAKEREKEINTRSYSEYNLSSNVYYIIGRIRALYREEHVYTLNQISTAINAIRVYPVEQIYYVLSLFIDNKNMVLFDKYGRFGNLINRGKYYAFQPIEITDQRSSVMERSIPVEYKRENIILEVPDKVVQTKQTKTTRPPKHKLQLEPKEPEPKEPKEQQYSDELREEYRETILNIRGLIDTVQTHHEIKSSEMNWYKNASRALDHLRDIYGLNDQSILRYVIYHYVESVEYSIKRILFEFSVDKTQFNIDPEIEEIIATYFQNMVMQSDTRDKEGVCIADKEDIQFLYREEGETKWKVGDKFDLQDFKTEFGTVYNINKTALNDIVGYMIQFKDQEMAFYYKDIHLTRNRKGRRCDRSGGKAPIISILNRVAKTAIYTEDNTVSVMYSGSLCVVLEMLLRHFQDETGDKIYYLTPEQAIQTQITNYSTKN